VGVSQQTINSARATAAYVEEQRQVARSQVGRRQAEREKRRAVAALNEAGRRVKAFGRLYGSPQHTEAFNIALQVITEIRDSENSR
jgi:hypothetical protein